MFSCGIHRTIAGHAFPVKWYERTSCIERIPGITVGHVNQGTHSRSSTAFPGINARVCVKVERYLAAFAAIGCHSDAARSRESGLDPKSIYRALRGEQVGEHFMARTVATLLKPEHRIALSKIGIEPTLDSLFEVEVTAAVAA